MKFVEWVKKFPGFIKDVRLELKKTSFPSRLEVTNTTLVVVVVVAIFGVYLWVVDTLVSAVLKEVFRSFEK